MVNFHTNSRFNHQGQLRFTSFRTRDRLHWIFDPDTINNIGRDMPEIPSLGRFANFQRPLPVNVETLIKGDTATSTDISPLQTIAEFNADKLVDELSREGYLQGLSLNDGNPDIFLKKLLNEIIQVIINDFEAATKQNQYEITTRAVITTERNLSIQVLDNGNGHDQTKISGDLSRMIAEVHNLGWTVDFKNETKGSSISINIPIMSGTLV